MLNAIKLLLAGLVPVHRFFHSICWAFSWIRSFFGAKFGAWLWKRNSRSVAAGFSSRRAWCSNDCCTHLRQICGWRHARTWIYNEATELYSLSVMILIHDCAAAEVVIMVICVIQTIINLMLLQQFNSWASGLPVPLTCLLPLFYHGLWF